MKKISLALLSSTLFLFGLGNIAFGEEAKTTTSSKNELNQAASEELKAKTETNQIYAKVIANNELKPTDFKSSIEDIYQLTITSIEFLENQHANTMTPGIFKIELLFKTSTGKIYKSKLPYLVENDHPTIFIDNINYDYQKKKVSFKSSEKEAKVYLKAENKYYTCTTDNNGYFEGKYNPETLPDSLQFVALDDTGNYSDEHILFLSTNEKDRKLTIDPFIYQENTNQIQGMVSNGTEVKIETPTKKSISVLPNNEGEFSYTYEKTPDIISFTLTNNNQTKSISTTPLKRNIKTLNELKKNKTTLSAVGEKRTKRTSLTLSGVLIVGALLLIIRHYLSARRQN